MISKSDKVAIVGASSDEGKYGYKVSNDLIGKGYHVYLVNPKGGEILGRNVYRSLDEIDGGVDLVIFVVPPQVTEKVLKDVYDLGIRRVWMQPGSESDEAIRFCEEKGIDCVHNSCIMMQ